MSSPRHPRSASASASANLARCTVASLVLLLSVLVHAAAWGRQSSDEPDAPPPMPEMRYFEAMERRQPQDRLDGVDAQTLCTTSSDNRFNEALAYAEEMESYSLLIWHGGDCVFSHYFDPFGPDLRPESASMHKSVAALLLAAAIADGYVDSVDDPVGRYLSQWAGDPRGDITLHDLLTMSSGLAPLSIEGGAESEVAKFIMGGGDEMDVLWSRELLKEPGSLFHYQGLNTQLLLFVIEAATGQRYIDYLSERLWQPLGNRDAYVWIYDEEQRVPRAFSALMATAEDWLRVGLLILNRGMVDGQALIPSSLIDAMAIPGEAYVNYGWQIWLGNEYEPMRRYSRNEGLPGFASAEPFATDDMIYFDGYGGQRVYISRKLELVLVRQGEMRRDWDDTRLPNLVINALEGAATP